jgi:HEAT repeat protein
MFTGGRMYKTQTCFAPLVRRGLVLAALVLAAAAPAVAGAQTRQVPADSLIYDLKNPDPVRRRDAATLIGQNKLQRATPDLVAAVNDSDASVRRAIAGALGQMSDPRVVPGFVALSRDTEKDIRGKAIEGMTTVYLPRESGLVVTLNKVATMFNPWSDEWADVVVEPDLQVDPTVIAALRDRLREDVDGGLRAKAARSLGILSAREALGDLSTAARNERVNDVRFEAVRALRKIGDPSVGADLEPLIAYGDTRVRNEAVYTIGRLRYAAAVPALTAQYQKEAALTGRNADKVYRERLLGAIAFIADPSSKDLFEREKTSTDPAIALHAYEGLARLADPATLDEISTARLREKDPKILTAQAWALYRLGRKEFLTAVVDALGSRRTNTEAREYLLELGHDREADLFPFATHKDPNVREAVAEILGRIGDERAVPVLRDMMRDGDGEVGDLASQAMRRINARAGS